MRGQFLQGRPRMLTRDLFAVANLLKYRIAQMFYEFFFQTTVSNFHFIR